MDRRYHGKQSRKTACTKIYPLNGRWYFVILAGTDDHLTRLSPVILNLESTSLTHLESEIRAFAADGKEMYQHVKHTCKACRAIVFAH